MGHRGLVFLVGFMASGKTTVGRLLSRRIGLPFADTDDIIEEKTGMRVREVFASRGEAEFRALEMEVLLELKRAAEGSAARGLGRRFDRLLAGLAGGGGAVIATGGGLPCSAEAMRLMKGLGLVVYLRAGVDDIIERLGCMGDAGERPVFKELRERALLRRGPDRGSCAQSARDALREEVSALLALREPFYLQADIVVDNGNVRDRRETASRIGEALEERRRG